MINSFEREMLAEPWQYINKEFEFADDFATACQIAVKYIAELEVKQAEYRATIDRLRAEWPSK